MVQYAVPADARWPRNFISIQYVAKQDSGVARGVARRYATLYQ
jgi:hypothetical protein